MGLFDSLRKKKKVDLEADFRANLLRNGRITDGVIIDNDVLETGETVVSYHYSVQGASFESSDILTEEQMQNSIKYAPGANVGVRYDPRHHGSSVLV